MRIFLLTKLLAIATVVAMGLSFLGRWHFMLDNLSSFKVHLALAFLLCSAVFIALRQFRWLGIAAVALAVSLVPIAPWFVPAGEGSAPEDGVALKLFASNVSPRLDDPVDLLNLLEKEQPDVFGLIEITPQFLPGLAPATSQYPYRYEAPEEGFWGLALYSRLPLSDARIQFFGDGVPPAIVASVQAGDTEVELILIHPFPPMTGELAKVRNLQLDRLAEYIGKSGRPTIVLGDLNTAMWSPYYQDFIDRSGLKNARQGSGVASTWPPNRLFGVPIDHVLHTEGITAHGFRVLPGIGSDHLPVAAQVAIIPVAAVADTRGDGDGSATAGESVR